VEADCRDVAQVEDVRLVTATGHTRDKRPPRLAAAAGVAMATQQVPGSCQ